MTLAYAPLTLGYAADTGVPVTLDRETLTQHGCVLGQTGTGKTAFLASLAVQQIQQGGGLIFCDTKRDARLLRALVYAAWHADRADQVRVFDVARPVHSYNPAASTNPLLVVRKTMQLLSRVPPGSEAEYHQDQVRLFLIHAVRALTATGLTPLIEDIQCLASDPDQALPILRQILGRRGALDYYAELMNYFRRFGFGERPDGERFRLGEARDSLSALTAAVGAITAGRLTKNFAKADGDLNLLESIRKDHLVYLGLPRQQDKEYGRFGELFLADLDAAIKEIQETEGRLANAPVLVILDEFPSYAIPDFAAVFEQARSAGVALIAGIQTLSGLADRAKGLSEEFRDRVLGNCATKVCFRLGEGESAEFLSKYVGKIVRPFLQESQTVSKGRSWNILTPSTWLGITQQSATRAGFTGTRMMKDLVLEGRVLTQLLAPRGQAILLGHGPDPIALWTSWIDDEAVPAGWPFMRVLPRIERAQPPLLGLARLVRERRLLRVPAGPEEPAGDFPGARGLGSRPPETRASEREARPTSPRRPSAEKATKARKKPPQASIFSFTPPAGASSSSGAPSESPRGGGA